MVKKITLALSLCSIVLPHEESCGMKRFRLTHSNEAKQASAFDNLTGSASADQLAIGTGVKRSHSALDNLSQSDTDNVGNKLVKADQDGETIRVKRPRYCVARLNADGSLEVRNMHQFNTITRQQAKRLTSITFCDMNIDDTFHNKFRELFASGMKTLIFKQCYADEVSIDELLGKNYPVHNLKVIECGLVINDADRILRVVNPFCIQTIDLSGNEFNREDLSILEQKYCGRKLFLEQPITCNPRFMPD